MLSVVDELSRMFPEREEALKAMAVSAIARKNLVLVGPPGTAKTMMVRAFARRMGWIGADWFSVQLNQFSTPEEVFGPVSIAALEKDIFRRTGKGYLPSAKVAYLDEGFKANSAILNALLSVLQERRWFDGSQWHNVPLEMAVITSNEVPEPDGELAALWDRFLVRLSVHYLALASSKRQILWNPPKLDDIPIGDDAPLKAARKAMEAVEVSANLHKRMLSLTQELSWSISDRRLVESLDLIKAHAALYGRKRATRADLYPLRWTLWLIPEHEPEVQEKVQDVVDIAAAAVKEFGKSLAELEQKIESTLHVDDESVKVAQVAAIAKEVKDLEISMNASEAEVKASPAFQELVRKVQQVRRELVDALMGDSAPEEVKEDEDAEA